MNSQFKTSMIIIALQICKFTNTNLYFLHKLEYKDVKSSYNIKCEFEEAMNATKGCFR